MDLATMRARVRDAIKDREAAEYFWSDDEVDSAIQTALDDYTSVFPAVASLARSGDDSTCVFEFVPPDDYLFALAIEHPVSETPPRWRKLYEISRGNIQVYGDPPSTGTDNVRVWYAKAHALNGTWTVCPEDEGLVVIGAAGYLAESGARYASCHLTVSRQTARELRQLGRDLLGEFERRMNPLRGRAVGPRWWPAWEMK